VLLLITLLVLAAIVTLFVLFPLVMLILVLSLVALLTLILLLRPIVDVRIGEETRVSVRVLFVKILLTPKKEKPLKLSDFRIARFRKRRRKLQRRYLLKKYRKELEKERKAAAKAKAEEEKKQATEEKPKRTLKENAAYVLDLLKLVILRAIKKFGRYLRIDLYYLYVTVGGKAPDKTAVTYGKLAQSVSYLTEIFDRHMNVHYPGKVEPRVYVGVDFLAEKTRLEAHLAFRISVWQVVAVALSALFSYLKMPKHEPKAAKAAEGKGEDSVSIDLSGHKVH